MLRLTLIPLLTIALAAATCDVGTPHSPPDDGEDPPPLASFVPMVDLDRNLYLGLYEGGLYPGGRDEPPADHVAAGRERARFIEPLDPAGRPDPGGKIVLLSIGMSNTRLEFCGPLGTNCTPGSFGGKALADPAVDHESLVIVNGAQSGEAAADWDIPGDGAYDVVRDIVLEPAGLDERQVQAVWLKQAHPHPTVSLPDPGADAVELERDLGQIVRSLADRYPNLQLVFLSSRIYGGYAKTPLNPEPYAYESGFAVKWLVEAQIEQARTGVVDSVAGDLDPARVPWVGWGPYLWTDGAEGRSDGLVWLPVDVRDQDGTHPTSSGIEKVGDLLLDFFKSSPVTRCWFLAGLDCG